MDGGVHLAYCSLRLNAKYAEHYESFFGRRKSCSDKESLSSNKSLTGTKKIIFQQDNMPNFILQVFRLLERCTSFALAFDSFYRAALRCFEYRCLRS